jgi:hypothetical protein
MEFFFKICTAKLCVQKLDPNIGFKKNSIFRQKLAKIAQINIDPPIFATSMFAFLMFYAEMVK